MNLRVSLLKLISNQLRLKSTNAGSLKKNHYESLGISPKSTQGEIKTAYYKLSMVYHPDKNNDETSLQKFRNITEAYEILGNVNTRKLYDKGLYFGSTTVADDTVSKFHKSREFRSRPPHTGGRVPIYDFDEWSKSHYGATFQRQMENKRRSEEYHYYREKTINDQKLEKMIFVMLGLILICMAFINNKSYDQFNNRQSNMYIKKEAKD